MAKRKRRLSDVSSTDTGEKKASKSKVPLVDAPAGLLGTMLQWGRAKSAKKTAEAQMEESEGKMIDPIQKLRLEQCESDGTVHASIKFKADGCTLQMTQQGAFLQMVGDDAEETLRAEFGDEQFDAYFGVQEFYEIDASRLTEDDEEAIIKALGPKRAGELISRKAKVVPNDSFINDMTLKQPIRQLSDRVRVNHGLLTLKKPSFRVVTMPDDD